MENLAIKEYLEIAEQKKRRGNWEDMVYVLNIVVQNMLDEEKAFKEIGTTKAHLISLWKDAYSEGGRSDIVIPKIPWGLVPQRTETLKRFLKSAEERLKEGRPDAAVSLLEVVIQGAHQNGISYEAIGTTEEYVKNRLRVAQNGQERGECNEDSGHK